MSTRPGFVIVGAGLAGAGAAEALRANGFDGRLLLLGEEAERPYLRPPLSKDYLQGLCEKDKLYVHPPDFYRDHGIELRMSTRVAAIDPARHQVVLAGNEPAGAARERIGYDKLLLATGSSPHCLRVPGSDLDGVCYLRSLADSEAISTAFASAARVVIIGGGWVGLETAAAARAAGVDVTVVEQGRLPLLRALGPRLGQIYAELHTRHHVHLRLGAQLTEILGAAGRAVGVRLTDGTRIDADIVVVGIGIAPNTELAVAAGLDVDNGIVVDEHLTSSHPDVYAAGDVANVRYPVAGRRLRLEHWSAASTQGPAAAANMAGRAASYDRVPYFFSDQYDMCMEYRGFAASGPDERLIFRGDAASGEYLAFWLVERRVGAAMNVNVWDQGDAITALLRSGRTVDADRLADPSVALDELAEGPAGAADLAGRKRADRGRPAARTPRPPRGRRVSVTVAAALPPKLVSVIRAVDDRLDVVYQPQCPAPAGDPGDHGEPQDAVRTAGQDTVRTAEQNTVRTVEQDTARTAEQGPSWAQQLARTDVLFGVPGDSAAALRQVVRDNPELRWVQSVSPAAESHLRTAGLTAEELSRVLVSGIGDACASQRAEFALFGMLAFGNDQCTPLTRLLPAEHGERRAAGGLAGQTALVVGLGPTGLRVARLAKDLGMTVLGINRTGRGGGPDAEMVRPPWFLGDLLPRAHAVVLALPSTGRTRGLIGAQAFRRIRTGAVIVDVGGVGVLDHDVLLRALDGGALSGAALGGPAAAALPPDSTLRDRPNVLISRPAPALSPQQYERVVGLFAENLRRYLDREPLVGTLEP